MTIFKTSTAFSSNNKETNSHTHSIYPGGEPLEWRPIHSEEELHLAAANGGSYYLATDIDLTKELKISKDMNLCLNDKVLKQTQGKSRVIYVKPKVTLNLCDCRYEGGTIRYWSDLSDGLWTLKTDDSISEHMTVGGVITGGYAYDGGGVFNHGTFTMYGGNITGNSASNYGGSVYNEGTFTMNGGSITGNSAIEAGGGVANYDSSFTMKGGSIRENSAKSGGGVYNCENVTFIMNSGRIDGNTAERGGGVYNESNAKFVMNGGSIFENSAEHYGGGMYNYNGTFTLNGGSITGKSGKDGDDIYNGRG